MKKPDEQFDRAEEGFELRLRSRATKTMAIEIPMDALASLEKVAASRDMTAQALLKFYIGQGLRQDLAKLSADRVLEKTAQVLTRHLQSEEEVLAILREIRVEAVA